MSPDGKEITQYDTPGELVVRSPSVVLGYLDNDKATKETFEDGWMRTGDEAMICLSSNNTEHVFIVDRIKELIKVKVSLVVLRRSTLSDRILWLINLYRGSKLLQLSLRRIY
jgi:acyl-CoA synthetase (AMP-forming)/AMP-acid ligase II